jgi:non-canonical (house-cleaning) NTP pyrophosphatase
MEAFAWVVVLAGQKVGRGRTGTFFLPPRVAELVRAGKELGEADDIVFGRSNSKQENGAVGLLTGDVIDRAGFYEHAVILALIPFKTPELF